MTELTQDKKSDESVEPIERTTLIKRLHIKIKSITSERGISKVIVITFETASYFQFIMHLLLIFSALPLTLVQLQISLQQFHNPLL